MQDYLWYLRLLNRILIQLPLVHDKDSSFLLKWAHAIAMSNVHRVGLLIIARCSDIDWSVCCNSIIDKPTLSRLTSEECFSIKGCQGESIQTVDNKELKTLENRLIKASFIRPDLPENEEITFRVGIEFYNLLEGFQGNKVPVVQIDNN